MLKQMNDGRLYTPLHFQDREDRVLIWARCRPHWKRSFSKHCWNEAGLNAHASLRFSHRVLFVYEHLLTLHICVCASRYWSQWSVLKSTMDWATEDLLTLTCQVGCFTSATGQWLVCNFTNVYIQTRIYSKSSASQIWHLASSAFLCRLTKQKIHRTARREKTVLPTADTPQLPVKVNRRFK